LGDQCLKKKNGWLQRKKAVRFHLVAGYIGDEVNLKLEKLGNRNGRIYLISFTVFSYLFADKRVNQMFLDKGL